MTPPAGSVHPVTRPALTTHAVVTGCQGCGACLLTCPQHAFRPSSGGLVVLPVCDGCGECVEICPVDAIHLAAGPVPSPPDFGRTP